MEFECRFFNGLLVIQGAGGGRQFERFIEVFFAKVGKTTIG